MEANEKIFYDSGSIISQLIGNNNTDLNHPSLAYAGEKNIFPLLHLGPIIQYKKFNLIRKHYKKSKNQNSIEFLTNYFEYCWINGKVDSNNLGFYQILNKFNQKLGIKSRAEEIKEDTRIDLYFIIKYIKLSGVFNENFFNKIWRDAPAEVRTALFLEEQKKKQIIFKNSKTSESAIATHSEEVEDAQIDLSDIPEWTDEMFETEKRGHHYIPQRMRDLCGS